MGGGCVLEGPGPDGTVRAERAVLIRSLAWLHDGGSGGERGAQFVLPCSATDWEES